MTLDDLRKKIVGGIHDATGAYNKIAAAVPLVPTTKTVAKVVSNVSKSIDSEIKALPTYTKNLSEAPRKSISKVASVRDNIVAQSKKAMPAFERGFNDAYETTYKTIAKPIVKLNTEIDKAAKNDRTGLLKNITEPRDAIQKMLDPKVPLVSKEGIKRYADATVKSLPLALTVATAGKTPAGAYIGNAAIGAGMNVLMSRPSWIIEGLASISPGIKTALAAYGNPHKKLDSDESVLKLAREGAVSGAVRAPIMSKITSVTNPAIEKYAPKVAEFIKMGKAKDLVAGVMSIPEGMLINSATGMPYTPTDLVIDFAMGAGASAKFGNKIKREVSKAIDDIPKLTPEQKAFQQRGMFGGTNAEGFDEAVQFSSLVDKKPRFEIDDSGATAIIPRAMKGEIYRLDQILGHDELYKNYPQLKALPVTAAKLEGGTRAIFDGSAIVFDEDFLRHPTAYDVIRTINPQGKAFDIRFDKYLSAEDRIKSVLLHETQHAIQGIEDFARGGTAKDFINRRDDTDVKVAFQRFLSDNPDAKELHLKVKKLRGDELINNEDFKKLVKIFDDRGWTKQQEAFATSDNYKILTPYDQYRRLAGEIEARDVQARMRLTADERRSIQPGAFQNIPVIEQIVRMGEGTSSSINPGETIGQYQVRLEREHPLLTRANDALSSKDYITAQYVVDEMKKNPVYAGYINGIQDLIDTGKIASSKTVNMAADAPNNATNRMYEMMSYGRIMQRAGYKAAQIKGTSLQQFKENILPRLPGQLRAEFLNSAAEVPKMLEMDPKQTMGAAKALLDKGVIRQDEFDEFVKMYSKKASLNPGAKTPMKQVMRDKYAIENQEAFDSLVEQKNNEEIISRMNRQNRPQSQSVKQDARTRFPSLDQMDAELERLFGDTSSGLKPFDKTAPLKDQIQRAKLELEYKRNPSIPVYDTPTKTKIANSAQQNAIDDKGEFMKYFAEWVGQRDAAKTRATKTAEPLAKIPKEYAWEVIKYIENPKDGVDESIKTHAREVSDLYESLYNQAKEEGIPMNKLVGYITHIWKETPEQVQQKMLGMGQKFKFGKEREIPTYEEGIAMKLTPKYTTPAEIVQEYVRRLEQVKSNIDFFTKLKKKGFVVDASVGAGHPGFEPITGQGFPQSISSTDGHVVTGSYYAPKDVAQIINRVFNPQEANKIAQKTAWASGKMQDVLMSGGLPKTPVNAWSLAQLQKELTAGRVTRPVASFIRSFSGEASNKFFSDNAGQIIKLQERNIPISSTFDASNMVDKPFINKTFGDGWGDVWHKVTSEPTFKRFMPQLQISFFNDVERRLLKAGKSPKEAADIAAEAVRNFYAVRGTDASALANPNTEALKTTFLFAPSYRETMIKFWLNNIKSIVPTHIVRENGGLKIKMNNPFSAQNINNTRFMIGSALTLAAYNQLNEYFNDGKNMLQNPRGREDQLLIPVSKITGNEKDKTVLAIPWLSSIAYMPRTALKIAKSTAEGDLKQIPRQAKGFLSTMLRPVADVVTNEDYFQNEIYNETDKPSEKWQKTGDYLFKQYGLQHPYMKTGYEAIQGKISSPFELAAKATELPIRFTNKDKLNSQYYYQNRDDVLRGLNEEERKAFLSLPKKSGQESESESSAETRIKYNTYVRYPAVLEAQKQIAIKQANGDMSKVDPLYALDSEQLKYFAAYTAASPGSYERRNILAGAPWIKEFQGIRSAFFDKVSRDKIAEDLKNGTITEDEAKQKIQALDENLAKYSGSSSSGSKKIKVRKVADIKKSKGTASKGRTIKLKKIARSMTTKASASSKVPTIKLKKKRTNTTATNMAKKFRVVIRKSVS